jgi:beta-N-acetylhexosaminidase
MTGRIMLDVLGLTLTKIDKDKLTKPAVGGVILFARNYASIEQVKSLIIEIRKLNPNLLIAVDHEGGRVQRFRDGFTNIPAMKKLGEVYDDNAKLAVEQAFSCGYILATELLSIGVDFSFTPVLDIDYGNSSVIGDRSFHSNPDIIVELASSLINGMDKAGMKSVAKHFPGHGYAKLDSHVALAVDNRSITELNKDISVFERVIKNGLDAVMLSHVIYPKIDDKPAGFSKKWIKDILRNQLEFKGIIFSDDLSMQGACFIKDINDRVKFSIDSGCDMVLICNNPELTDEVIANNWQLNDSLKIMKANKVKNFDKTKYKKHLTNIKNLVS